MIDIQEITACRLCGNKSLEEILNLGSLSLTGVFPPETDCIVSTAPLELVKCHGPSSCYGQIRH